VDSGIPVRTVNDPAIKTKNRGAMPLVLDALMAYCLAKTFVSTDDSQAVQPKTTQTANRITWCCTRQAGVLALRGFEFVRHGESEKDRRMGNLSSILSFLRDETTTVRNTDLRYARVV
jgi:hypothetical protein